MHRSGRIADEQHRQESKHGRYVEAVEEALPPGGESGANDRPSLETGAPWDVEEAVVDFAEQEPLFVEYQMAHVENNGRFSLHVQLLHFGKVWRWRMQRRQ